MVKAVPATAAHALFYEHYVDDLAPIVGGKNASLGAMTAAGFPVPAGFAVPTTAFLESLERTGAAARVAGIVTGLDVRDLDALGRVAELARRHILDTGPSGSVDIQMDPDPPLLERGPLRPRTGRRDAVLARRPFR